MKPGVITSANFRVIATQADPNVCPALQQLRRGASRCATDRRPHSRHCAWRSLAARAGVFDPAKSGRAIQIIMRQMSPVEPETHWQIVLQAAGSDRCSLVMRLSWDRGDATMDGEQNQVCGSALPDSATEC